MLFLMTGRSWWRIGLLAAGLVPWAAAAPPERAAIDRLPRPLAQTPSAQKIARMLAQKDARFRQDSRDCLIQSEEAKKNSQSAELPFYFRVGARRLLETPTLYSVEVAQSWYCGGPYPGHSATALNFD